MIVPNCFGCKSHKTAHIHIHFCLELILLLGKLKPRETHQISSTLRRKDCTSTIVWFGVVGWLVFSPSSFVLMNFCQLCPHGLKYIYVYGIGRFTHFLLSSWPSSFPFSVSVEMSCTSSSCRCMDRFN